MTWNSYAEWYMNTRRIDGSPTALHHEAVYGSRDYYDFQGEFDELSKRWADGMDEWMKEVKDCGFEYIVLTTKHHDGYTLWPTAFHAPYSPVQNISHNLVKTIADSARKHHLKIGLYYSGGFDWTWQSTMDPVLFHPKVPHQPQYAKTADEHLLELINTIKPDILWNDIQWPEVEDGKSHLNDILRHYLKIVPEGLINDRFFIGMHPQPYPGDFQTPEYKSHPPTVQEKWETCRGISNSFGYNSQDSEKDCIQHSELIRLLVNVVSNGGNLLLNVGPIPDGSISPPQKRRLRTLKRWMKVHSLWLKHSRVWKSTSAETLENTEVRVWIWYDYLILVVLGDPVEHVIVRGLDLSGWEDVSKVEGELATFHGTKKVVVHTRLQDQGWELSFRIPVGYFSLLEMPVEYPDKQQMQCLAYMVKIPIPKKSIF
jgi:alpha-L-fucosidase